LPRKKRLAYLYLISELIIYYFHRQGRDGLVKTWDAERLFALPASAELDVFPASSSSSPLSAVLHAAPASELPLPPLSVLKTDSYSFCPLGITEQIAASSNPLVPDSSTSDSENPSSSAPVSTSKPNSSLLGQALRQQAANRPSSSSATSTPVVGAAHASVASDLIACPGENPSEVDYFAFHSCRTFSSIF
jgi:hypothetical protein